MKKFVVGLLTNRFGIVLATLNVCYFAFCGFDKIFLASNNFDKIMTLLNVPSFILTALPLKVVGFLFSIRDVFSYRERLSIVFLIFVTLQWLFIGWFAKTIAQKIQAMRN